MARDAKPGFVVLANIEKDIADEILRANGAGASRLGLRFDRVVVAVLGDLRSFAETAAAGRATVLVTISAPIRLPAKTADELKREIGARLAEGAPRGDLSATVHGNSVRLRLVDLSPGGTPSLIGFVHNPDRAPEPLLDLAERWLRGRAAP
jgi:hypothetical protein